jgi:cobalamin biosynthesis protein CobT
LPSPTKLNVHILVDASGSMSGDRACRAQDMAGTLVAAFRRIPTVRLEVWQHNAIGSTAVAYRVAAPGVAPKLDQMLDHVGGGNADGFALEFVGKRALAVAKSDEKNLVIVISDGLPSVSGHGATNRDLIKHSAWVATELRRKGCDVMSVAIAGDDEAHIQMYGKGNVVPFTNDWSALSRSFAAVFGKVLAGRDRATAHC